MWVEAAVLWAAAPAGRSDAQGWLIVGLLFIPLTALYVYWSRSKRK